jgi:prepilin-type N-terminal cleavage/methylation domain-containing protein
MGSEVSARAYARDRARKKTMALTSTIPFGWTAVSTIDCDAGHDGKDIMRRMNAFTLIELLAVIAIIASTSMICG